MKIKKISVVLILCLMLASMWSVSAFAVTEGLPKVIDNAELLTPEQEEDLTNKILQINSAYNFEVVIHTTLSCGEKTPQAYADDYYDYSGYDSDGVILVIDIGGRNYYISTKGYGITAFTDYGLAELEDAFVPKLSEGDYYGASCTFINTAVNYLDAAKSGTPYDVPPEPEKKKGFGAYFLAILICTAVSAGIGGVSVAVMKSKMNTARSNNMAENYIDRNSVNITQSDDMFLYATVTKTRIETDSDHGSSGGSSTHTSSSGSTHGGSGGKF